MSISHLLCCCDLASGCASECYACFSIKLLGYCFDLCLDGLVVAVCELDRARWVLLDGFYNEVCKVNGTFATFCPCVVECEWDSHFCAVLLDEVDLLFCIGSVFVE